MVELKEELVDSKFEEELAKKWIQKADVKEGGLTEWCKANGFKGVCQACINKAAKSGGHPAKMASFACNMANSPYTYPTKKESQSVEESKMEEKKEEQLIEERPRDKTKDKPIEVKKEVEPSKEEPKVEEKVPEVKEVPKKKKPKKEKLEEEPEEKKEEVKPNEKKEEKVEPEKKDDVSKDCEKINEDIKETKEELAVITEVRDELVTLYANYGDLEKKKEQLEKENTEFKKDIEQLNSQLKRYKDAEEKLASKQRQDRLEKLSAKFKVLGQEKTVEQLDKKDSETLDEFEKIVDAAIEKTGDTKEMPAKTEQSQAEVLSEEPKSDEEKKPSEEKKAPVKEETSESFFKGLCKTLSKEQTGMNNSVKFM